MGRVGGGLRELKPGGTGGFAKLHRVETSAICRAVVSKEDAVVRASQLEVIARHRLVVQDQIVPWGCANGEGVCGRHALLSTVGSPDHREPKSTNRKTTGVMRNSLLIVVHIESVP